MTSCFLVHKQLSSHCVLTESSIKACFLGLSEETLIPFDRTILSWLNRPTKASSANIIISGIKRFNMQSGRTQRFSMHKVTSVLFLPKMHSYHLIMWNHQPLKPETFYKINDQCNSEVSSSWKEKNSSQISWDQGETTAKCILESRFDFAPERENWQGKKLFIF